MASSIVFRYCLMFLNSIRFSNWFLRFLAMICPPTRRNNLNRTTNNLSRTTKEKDLKFVSNARLFNLILQLLHGGVNIYHHSHLFYYLMQQGQVGIPRTLLIPVRASGTLVTLKETGGTGSTLRTVETRWMFTATWQLTEVRSDLESLKLL